MHHAHIPICCVLGDRRCGALVRAERLCLPVELVDRMDFTRAFEAKREEFTAQVLDALVPYNIELVVMVGFMTVLSVAFFRAYPERVINLHPSLLPAFKGAHAVRDLLATHPRPIITGSTVHLATEVVDEGRHLAKSSVPVYAHDTEESLTNRIKLAEHKVLPGAVRGYMLKLKTKPLTPA
jgi:phosphoribosylglycinamide formyltransferase-1